MRTLNLISYLMFSAAITVPFTGATAQEDLNFNSALELIAKGSVLLPTDKAAEGIDYCKQARAFLVANPTASPTTDGLVNATVDMCISIGLFRTGSVDEGGSSCDYLGRSLNVVLPISEDPTLNETDKAFAESLLERIGKHDSNASCQLFP